jgi:hypothetical protein
MGSTSERLDGLFHHRFRREVVRLADRETNHIGWRRSEVCGKATTNV